MKLSGFKRAGINASLVVILILVLLPPVFSTVYSAGNTVVLRFNQFTPKTHWYHYKILEPWIADIEKVTEGRVRVKFTTAQLGPFHRNFDIANVLSGLIAHEFPPRHCRAAYSLASDHRHDAMGILFDWTKLS